MPLTLKDIARMAGVAESTVSRAINNKPGVGEETRKRIMKLVRKYNYRPNQLARGLAKKETQMLALIVADFTSADYKIIKSIEAYANEQGYNCIICNTNNDLQKEEAYLSLLSNQQVDGAIIIGGELANKNIINAALNKNGLMVLVNCLAEELLIPTILVDSGRGGYLATTHLLQEGIREIAIVMGSRKDYLESEKLTGYLQALADYNINPEEKHIIETDSSREGGYKAFFQALEQGDLPGGFFVTKDILAVGLVDAIKMGGYLIPEDFSIVGYGESIITSIIDPALTVVAEPQEELGRYAAEYIINLINGRNPEEIIKVLEPVLKIGESSVSRLK